MLRVLDELARAGRHGGLTGSTPGDPSGVDDPPLLIAVLDRPAGSGDDRRRRVGGLTLRHCFEGLGRFLLFRAREGVNLRLVDLPGFHDVPPWGDSGMLANGVP